MDMVTPSFRFRRWCIIFDYDDTRPLSGRMAQYTIGIRDLINRR